MANDSRALVCLIKGESTPFIVEIAGNKDIMDLKDLIKEEEQISAPARNLTLWKPTEDMPFNPSETFPQRVGDLVQGQRVAELDCSHDVAVVWPEQPHHEHLHILVGLPSVTVPIKQLSRSLEIDAVNQLVSEELNSLREEVEDFLKSPNPPVWVSPASATPSDCEFFARLKLPTYRRGNPSLLFHDLHLCDVEKIKEMYEPGRHMCICNTSGSGKTRRMLELLTTYWGFYFVAIPDTNGVGVQDLEIVLEELRLYSGWVTDLEKDPERRVDQNKINANIASLYLKRVLAARIAVFKLFLELAVKADGGLLEKHKLSWLFFQASYPHHPVLKPHPIVRIMNNCFRDASSRALDAWIERLGEIRVEHKPHLDDFIIGLDEAQRAVRLHPRPFLSATDDNVFRSILREIVKTFIKQPVTLFVSGTGVTMEELQDTVGSGVSKPVGIESFHDLGMFDTWPSLMAFLERYLPDTFLKTPSGIILQQRIQEYLLGRYRFSVSFVEHLLKNGLQSPHTLLTEYIKAHTLCDLGNTGLPYASHEPKLKLDVQVASFEWDRLWADQETLEEAVLIVQSHLTLGKTPTFGPVSVKLVEYGVARLQFDGKHHGQIVEPLAFLSLLKWLEKHPKINLTANLKLRLAFDPSRGSAYEEVVILFLLRVMRHKVPFTSIFNFHGTPPPWTNDKAQVVGYLDGKRLAVDALGNEPENPALAVVQFADNMEAIIEWIEKRNPNGTPAVLVPTNLFGPDILIWCGDALLMGQAKSCVAGNKSTLDADTTSKALDSLHPEHWFKVSRQNPTKQLEYQRLVNAINAQRVIRFVAGYPLPPDLGSTALSVRRAITAHGDNPLATIRVDTFRAHFIDENQSCIIKTLDHALETQRDAEQGKKTDAKKQKGYDMDSGGGSKVKREAEKQEVVAKKQKK